MVINYALINTLATVGLTAVYFWLTRVQTKEIKALKSTISTQSGLLGDVKAVADMKNLADLKEWAKLTTDKEVLKVELEMDKKLRDAYGKIEELSKTTNRPQELEFAITEVQKSVEKEREAYLKLLWEVSSEVYVSYNRTHPEMIQPLIRSKYPDSFKDLMFTYTQAYDQYQNAPDLTLGSNHPDIKPHRAA